jgi:hypothetical protein
MTLSNNFQPPYVNPHPHLHAKNTPPWHVDIVQPNNAHVAIDVQNPLGAFAIRSAVEGPPPPR